MNVPNLFEYKKTYWYQLRDHIFDTYIVSDAKRYAESHEDDGSKS